MIFMAKMRTVRRLGVSADGTREDSARVSAFVVERLGRCHKVGLGRALR